MKGPHHVGLPADHIVISPIAMAGVIFLFINSSGDPVALPIYYSRANRVSDENVLLCRSRTPHPIWYATSLTFCRIFKRTCVMPLVFREVGARHRQAAETIDNSNFYLSGDFRQAHMAGENPSNNHIKQLAGLPNPRSVILLVFYCENTTTTIRHILPSHS